MSKSRSWLAACLSVLLSCHGALVFGNSLEELQAAGQLQLSTNLVPSEGIVPGQKTSLILEIATDRWFTGGTGISIPEVPGLIILQTEQFASNSSETRGSQSWVVQRWTLDVYPQRAGEFTIPPLQLRVKVNDGESGDVQGELTSPPTNFEVAIPQSLAQAEHWVAAPAFEVRQNFDRPLEGLQTGDAFEQEIVFEAADVMAMMLPTFSPQKLPGLAAYPSPPVLENSSNRGKSGAIRTQRISYVVEAEGEYLLPGQDYFWWDTRRAELKLLSLPATTITVGTGISAAGETSAGLEPRQILAVLIGLILLSGIAWLLKKWLPRLPLAQFTSTLSLLWQQLKALRKPALPERLNPGNSAGE